MEEKNRYIHYSLVLFIIAALSAGILAYVNSLTAGVIYENANKLVNEARAKVLSVAENFNEKESKIVEDLTFIPGYNSENEVVGYVVQVTQAGYAGDIDFVLGIDLNNKITGLDIITSQETPGLGSKINNEDWKSHWQGKASNHVFDKSVDSFAGATISPTAVYTGMMRALKVFEVEVNK